MKSRTIQIYLARNVRDQATRLKAGTANTAKAVERWTFEGRAMSEGTTRQTKLHWQLPKPSTGPRCTDCGGVLDKYAMPVILGRCNVCHMEHGPYLSQCP